jgi:hypothetical protein
LQVVVTVGTAVFDGDFVVNFGGGSQSASGFAKFAKRVFGDVQVPDRAPAAVVNLVGVRAAGLIVLPGDKGFVLGAVAFEGAFNAAGVVALVGDAVGHGRTPFKREIWFTYIYSFLLSYLLDAKIIYIRIDFARIPA